ncbi:hypothetical protein DPEC_G00036850 [Dallia pectoralis]|uniref:Uncharacterized protein n=1 Tax=Dallia pectoralis TaxID=75939 RepID=A0ACC2HEL9_DALPE|nr:hypothetical protein DPEC_G00036850 [Dallia pectoralis]
MTRPSPLCPITFPEERPRPAGATQNAVGAVVPHRGLNSVGVNLANTVTHEPLVLRSATETSRSETSSSGKGHREADERIPTSDGKHFAEQERGATGCAGLPQTRNGVEELPAADSPSSSSSFLPLLVENKCSPPTAGGGRRDAGMEGRGGGGV